MDEKPAIYVLLILLIQTCKQVAPLLQKKVRGKHESSFGKKDSLFAIWKAAHEGGYSATNAGHLTFFIPRRVYPLSPWQVAGLAIYPEQGSYPYPLPSHRILYQPAYISPLHSSISRRVSVLAIWQATGPAANHRTR